MDAIIIPMKRAISLVLILLLLLCTAGCGGGKSAYQKYTYEFFGTFDTVIQIMGYSKSQAEFDGWTKKAEARFVELNKLYDMYHDYPGLDNIKTINDNAGKKPVKVAPDILKLVQFSRLWHDKSPGVVNIALGAVLSIWHDYREKGISDPANAALPPADALKAAAKHTDITKVIVDESAGTVYLSDPLMSLDLGAVAKGYATEVVAQELQGQGWQSFIINGGGNVRVVGKPEDGVRQKWGVGITDPNDPGTATTAGSLLDTAFVADKSVVTSGDYQRFYTVGGKNYNHIIDPGTLTSATNFRAVTIITQDSGEADYLSTTLFILPYDKGLDYIKSVGNAEALWIFPDGTMKATDGMKAMLKGMGGATSK
jgi:FAD:protein FMN transferase